MAKSVQFSADARRRFPVDGLSVTSRVLGQSHDFDFKDHRIKLSLPTASPPDVADWARRTRKTGWRTKDPDNPDTTIHRVFDIELSTSIPQRLSIDERALAEPPKSRHVTHQQEQKLNRIADDYARFLAGAWDHWQAVVRWVAGPNSIGRAEATVGEDAYGGDATYICRRSDGRRIWSQTTVIHVPSDEPFDAARWQLLQDVLSSGELPPIWFNFISEAHQRIESFDNRGAIVSAAVACETIVRSMYWLNVSQVRNAEVRDRSDRKPVGEIISQWGEVAGAPTFGKWDAEPIQRLFYMRNRLLHLGEAPATPSEVREALVAATNFISQADAVYCAKTAIENWPARYRAISTDP